MVLAFHKQVIDNAEHFSGKCDCSNILLSAPCEYPQEESLRLELFLVLDMAFAT